MLILFVYDQGAKIWSKCYHSFIYPVASFVQVEGDNISSVNTSARPPSWTEEQPLANSTLLDSSMPQRSGNVIKGDNNSSLGNPDGTTHSNSFPKYSAICNTDSGPRNPLPIEGHVVSSRNPDVSNECNTNPCSRYSTHCNTNSCPGISAIVSNECHVSDCPRNPNVSTESHVNSSPRNIIRNSGTYSVNEDLSYDVGHISHIPRTPPKPTTYTIPCLGQNNISSTCGTAGTTQNVSPSARATQNTSQSFGTTKNPNISMSTAIETTLENESLFGMIALKEHDVCYTSGTIEWVGRKRSYPLNTGFKVINENCTHKATRGIETKKKRKLDRTFIVGMDSTKECDCTDVLPTVNAIVDHLNALHEAVDLVDLRLSNLEETV